MKRKWLAPVVLLLALSSGACRSDELHGVELKIDRRSLGNGLQVVMIEDHTASVVSYQTWFRVGSVDEWPGITGATHLFEHLMFKGTDKFAPRLFFELLESNGAEVNANTARDYTVFYENFPPSLLERVIEMEADRMVNVKVTQELLDGERHVVFEERRAQIEGTETALMHEALWQIAFRAHPYRWPVFGYPQDVISVKAERLQEFYRTYYQPSNAAIVIAGDFDPDATYRLIRNHYGAIPKTERPAREHLEEPPQTSERRLTVPDPRAPTERFVHGYHITQAGHADSYALDVLANILFEGSGSRAYRLLVDQERVATYVSGSSYTPTFPGLLLTSVVMKAGAKAQTAERLLDGLYVRVVRDGVSAEEVEAAVRQLAVHTLDSLRTPFGVAQFAGMVESILGDATLYSDDFKRYASVTPEDVRRVAAKYLDPNNRSAVVVHPGEPARARASARAGDARTRKGKRPRKGVSG